jgi:predicted phage tail protein
MAKKGKSHKSHGKKGNAGPKIGCGIIIVALVITVVSIIVLYPKPAPAAPTIPGSPLNLTATAEDQQIKLDWVTPVDNGGSAITGYNVYMGATSTNETYLDTIGNVTTCTALGLSNGQEYWFIVGAFNAVGNGTNATETHAIPATTPSAPRNFAATSGANHVDLTWVVPASNGGAAITNYTLYRSTHTGNETYFMTLGNVTAYNNTGLTNGTKYYYKIQAVNVMGNGTNATETSATAANLPSAPQNAAVTTGISWLYVNWTAPLNNGGSTITEYNVYRSVSSGAEKYLTHVAVLHYNDTLFSQNTTRYYIIQAVNGKGNGTNSSEVYGTTWTTPSKPLTPAAASHKLSVYLTWTTPASNGGQAITGYRIYKGTTTNTEVFLANIGVLLYYNATGLTGGQIYYFKIAAINSIGAGANCTEVNATPTT